MSNKDDGQRFLFPPYASGSDTSHDAAKSMASHTGTIRGRVLEYIRTFCDNGATCDQCELDAHRRQREAPEDSERTERGRVD
jgi:hypothetical protein